MSRKVWVSGNKTRMYWTLRALARAGYMVVEEAEMKIFVTETGWKLKDKEIDSVEILLHELNQIFTDF